MERFRKRLSVIEAEQWFPNKQVEGVIVSPVLEPTDYNPSGVYGQIKTPEGWDTCIAGDWIVKNANGEFSVCKSDVFEATYESVEAA